jgi:hypothetical protein
MFISREAKGVACPAQFEQWSWQLEQRIAHFIRGM